MAKQRSASGAERRLHARYSVSMIVDAQPLDEQFRPQGQQYQMVTRDISAAGVGILDTREPGTKYLALELTNAEGKQLRVATEVVRCQPQARQVYDIGTKFIPSASMI